MARRKHQQSTALAPVRPITVQVVDRVVGSQPSVRVQQLWNPALIRALELQADGGDLYRLGDLCDQMLADDRIGELLDTLVGDVLACDLTFEEGPRSTVGNAEKADELDVDWPIGFDEDELKQLGMWAEMVGVGFAKQERWVENDGRIVQQVKCWHPKHFRVANIHDPKTRTWEVRNPDGTTTPIAAGDGTWIIVTRRGEFRPWANGLWRQLKDWWMLKEYAKADWGLHSEKASKFVVEQNENAMGADRSEDRRIIANEIYDASKNAVIALPQGFKMSLLEVSANTEQIYNAQINAANEAFTISILGQNLSTKVEGGSLAAAQSHAAKEAKRKSGVAKNLAQPLQQQALVWWAEYNFGDRALAPYPKWHTEPPEDQVQKATALKTTADALLSLKTAGYRLSADQIEEDYGLELEELPEPDPQPPAAGPGGAPQGPGRPMAPESKQPTRPQPQAFLASANDYSIESAKGGAGDQPRVPAGNSAGGQWTSTRSGFSVSERAALLNPHRDRLAAARAAHGKDPNEQTRKELDDARQALKDARKQAGANEQRAMATRALRSEREALEGTRAKFLNGEVSPDSLREHEEQVLIYARMSDPRGNEYLKSTLDFHAHNTSDDALRAVRDSRATDGDYRNEFALGSRGDKAFKKAVGKDVTEHLFEETEAARERLRDPGRLSISSAKSSAVSKAITTQHKAGKLGVKRVMAESFAVSAGTDAAAQSVFLASGDSASAAPGFVRGQLYVDDLSDRGAALAADSLSGLVERLMAAIDGAEDYEQARHAILQAFRDEQDPDRLVDIIQAGIVLSNLAGRNAVAEDAAPYEPAQIDAEDADWSAESVEFENETDDDRETQDAGDEDEQVGSEAAGEGEPEEDGSQGNADQGEVQRSAQVAPEVDPRQLKLPEHDKPKKPRRARKAKPAE